MSNSSTALKKILNNVDRLDAGDLDALHNAVQRRRGQETERGKDEKIEQLQQQIDGMEFQGHFALGGFQKAQEEYQSAKAEIRVLKEQLQFLKQSIPDALVHPTIHVDVKARSSQTVEDAVKEQIAKIQSQGTDILGAWADSETLNLIQVGFTVWVNERPYEGDGSTVALKFYKSPGLMFPGTIDELQDELNRVVMANMAALLQRAPTTYDMPSTYAHNTGVPEPVIFEALFRLAGYRYNEQMAQSWQDKRRELYDHLIEPHREKASLMNRDEAVRGWRKLVNKAYDNMEETGRGDPDVYEQTKQNIKSGRPKTA